jgi:hypothetical protein
VPHKPALDWRHEQTPQQRWPVIAPLLPAEPPKPTGGRPRLAVRKILIGIIFVLMSRIPQEALTNVARHSGATHIEMRLMWTDGALAMTVRDDGQGFVADEAAGRGLGLASIRERVKRWVARSP